MTKVVIGMTMSLDGFVQDANGSVAALYPDLATLRDTEPLRRSIENTGAVVMGWRTYAMAGDPDSYAGNYEYQVPIFVVSHEQPAKHPKETDALKFRFVLDGLESALSQAKIAAGEKDVTVVGGPLVIRACLRDGLADELEIDIMPVLLGKGLRLFDGDDARQVQLERVRVVELPGGRTHLSFRIVN